MDERRLARGCDVIMSGAGDASHVLVLAPGSQMSIDAAPMTHIALALAQRGIDVLRFAFPEAASGDDASLVPHFAAVLDQLQHRGKRVIGGWSLGGRIAAQLAAQNPAGAQALVCLSYPFHPKGQPRQRTAVEALENTRLPTLIVQGSRDAFGNREQVRGYRLPGHIQLRWLEGANHGLHARPRAGVSHEQLLDEASAAVAEFVLAS